jgi:hypothetical protein
VNRSTTSVSVSSSPIRFQPFRRVSALALLLAPVAACVSFRVTPPDPPELTVAYVALLSQVDEKADFSGDLPSQPVQPGAEAVCALVKIQTIRRPLSLVWRWYAPDGALARRSPPVVVNARRTELEHAVEIGRAHV